MRGLERGQEEIPGIEPRGTLDRARGASRGLYEGRG
jgi:hypothetical protein